MKVKKNMDLSTAHLFEENEYYSLTSNGVFSKCVPSKILAFFAFITGVYIKSGYSQK